MPKIYAGLLLCFISQSALHPQPRTVGVLLHDARAWPGYTLFAPIHSTTAYLIDNDGRQVHSWSTPGESGQAVYLLENGELLHARSLPPPGNTGRIRMYDWNGVLTWDFEYNDAKHLLHHDVKMLPNGNVLMIAWEFKTPQEAIAAGRDTSVLTGKALWPDHLIEVKRTGPRAGEIVWEWHAWDHLVQERDSTKPNFGVVSSHPERIDLNYVAGGSGADWMHSNSVAYNTDFDQILISVHNFSEIWVIDHGTTTAEAAGHGGGKYGRGGDILYRWGNPAAFRRGSAADQILYGQHDAQWIGAGLPGGGDILLFNNGLNRSPGKFSTVDQLTPPSDSSGRYPLAGASGFAPGDAGWRYIASPPESFFSPIISGVQRLPNGNTLICSGVNGIFFEVTPSKEIVWQYVNPVTDVGILSQGDTVPSGLQGKTNSVFKIRRYAPDYPAFTGRNLHPGGYVEKYDPAPVTDAAPAGDPFVLYPNYPNPFAEQTRIRFILTRPEGTGLERSSYLLQVYDALGRTIFSRESEAVPGEENEILLDKRTLTYPLLEGLYFCRLTTASGSRTLKMICSPGRHIPS